MTIKHLIKITLFSNKFDGMPVYFKNIPVNLMMNWYKANSILSLTDNVSHSFENWPLQPSDFWKFREWLLWP